MHSLLVVKGEREPPKKCRSVHATSMGEIFTRHHSFHVHFQHILRILDDRVKFFVFTREYDNCLSSDIFLFFKDRVAQLPIAASLSHGPPWTWMNTCPATSYQDDTWPVALSSFRSLLTSFCCAFVCSAEFFQPTYLRASLLCFIFQIIIDVTLFQSVRACFLSAA